MPNAAKAIITLSAIASTAAPMPTFLIYAFIAAPATPPVNAAMATLIAVATTLLGKLTNALVTGAPYSIMSKT